MYRDTAQLALFAPGAPSAPRRVELGGQRPHQRHSIASTTWSETALTWNTWPARGTTVLASNTIDTTTRQWYEWDVTSYVRVERAAGRTTVSFVLVGTVSTNPYATFYSRNAGSSRPEWAIASEAPPASTDDVVLYGVDATAFAGTWQLVADSTAAAGIRMHNPDAGSPKLTSALASPAHFAKWSFAAEAGRAYRLWIRGRADRNAYVNDSVFVQFSTSVTASGSATYRIGTTSATAYVLEDCSGCGVKWLGMARQRLRHRRDGPAHLLRRDWAPDDQDSGA